MKKESKMIGSWIFGFIFILFGVGFIFSEIIPGILMLIAGFLILPPITKKVEKKGNFKIPTWAKVVFLIVIFGISGSMLPDDSDYNTDPISNEPKDIPNQIEINSDSEEFKNPEANIRLTEAIQPTKVYNEFVVKGKNITMSYGNSIWFSDFLDKVSEEEFCGKKISPSEKYMASGPGYLLLVNAETYEIECDYLNSDESKEEVVPEETKQIEDAEDPQPEPIINEPKPSNSGNTICSSDHYNCGDFSNYQDAKDVFDACSPGDIHGLDGDNDGIPCESLQ